MSQIVKYHTMNIQEFTRKMLPLSHKIFRLSLRLLNEEEDARDAVQEVYLRLWNRKETLGQYRSFEAVAMTSARNYCLDRLKSHSHKMTVHGYNTETMRAYQPHEIFEKKQLAGEIRKTIASLPETQKCIVHLRDVEGYEIKDIASIMEMNENAVRTALSRARQKVRDEIIKKETYEPVK